MINSRKPAIELRNVSKEFRYWTDRPSSVKALLVDIMKARINVGVVHRFDVLKDVSFSIYPGEFVGIMGRNGAGKSTILKLICGIYTPQKGTIHVDGAIAPLIELGAGFNAELSGYENIFLCASIMGFGRRVTLDAVDTIIAFSELGEMINMPVKNYSSGMLVRLGFSIATHLEAPTLLIDEILAVGDAGFQKKCIDKINQIHHQGRTIVLITHSAADIRRHCQRCIVIDEHRKIFDGDAAEGADIYLEKVMPKVLA
jgi:ABC-2 type transport system ATP-binding protein